MTLEKPQNSDESGKVRKVTKEAERGRARDKVRGMLKEEQERCEKVPDTLLA